MVQLGEFLEPFKLATEPLVKVGKFARKCVKNLDVDRLGIIGKFLRDEVNNFSKNNFYQLWVQD